MRRVMSVPNMVLNPLFFYWLVYQLYGIKRLVQREYARYCSPNCMLNRRSSTRIRYASPGNNRSGMADMPIRLA